MVKFSVYLNRHVFILYKFKTYQLNFSNRAATFLKKSSQLFLPFVLFYDRLIVFVYLSLWYLGLDVELIVSVPGFTYLFKTFIRELISGVMSLILRLVSSALAVSLWGVCLKPSSFVSSFVFNFTFFSLSCFNKEIRASSEDLPMDQTNECFTTMEAEGEGKVPVKLA